MGPQIAPPAANPTASADDGACLEDRGACLETDVEIFKQGMRIMIVGTEGFDKREAVVTGVATSGTRKGQLYVIVGTHHTRIWSRNALIISEPLDAGDVDGPLSPSSPRHSKCTDSDPGRDVSQFAKGMQVRLRGLDGLEGEMALVTALGSRSRSNQLYIYANGRTIRIFMENAVPIEETDDRVQLIPLSARKPSTTGSAGSSADVGSCHDGPRFAKDMQVNCAEGEFGMQEVLGGSLLKGYGPPGTMGLGTLG